MKKKREKWYSVRVRGNKKWVPIKATSQKAAVERYLLVKMRKKK